MQQGHRTILFSLKSVLVISRLAFKNCKKYLQKSFSKRKQLCFQLEQNWQKFQYLSLRNKKSTRYHKKLIKQSYVFAWDHKFQILFFQDYAGKNKNKYETENDTKMTQETFFVIMYVYLSINLSTQLSICLPICLAAQGLTNLIFRCADFRVRILVLCT